MAARCGQEALAVVGDVTQRADVERVLDAALARFGHVDVWVNNAGRGITRLGLRAHRRGPRRDDARQREVGALRDAGGAAALQGARDGATSSTSRRCSGRVPFAPHPLGVHRVEARAQRADGEPAHGAARRRIPDIHVSTRAPRASSPPSSAQRAATAASTRAQMPARSPPRRWPRSSPDVLEHPRADVYTRPGRPRARRRLLRRRGHGPGGGDGARARREEAVGTRAQGSGALLTAGGRPAPGRGTPGWRAEPSASRRRRAAAPAPGGHPGSTARA